jgi:hypothetical protein
MFTHTTQCVRGVLDPPVSAFSLSLYRHTFLYTLFSSRFTLIINNNVFTSTDYFRCPWQIVHRLLQGGRCHYLRGTILSTKFWGRFATDTGVRGKSSTDYCKVDDAITWGGRFVVPNFQTLSTPISQFSWYGHWPFVFQLLSLMCFYYQSKKD